MRSAHIGELFSFTGWIFGLTSESKDNDKRIGSDTVTVSDGTREKIARLRYVNTLLNRGIVLQINFRSRSDIERLQVMVTEERERYQVIKYQMNSRVCSST